MPLLIAHTLGCPMITPKHMTWIAKSANSVAETPIAADTGPAIAEPTGINTNEKSESYELTRERDSSGTCCWNTVNQSARCTAMPIPAKTEIATRI